jgi:hypothetical protein
MNVRKQNFMTSRAARARRMRQLAAKKPTPAEVEAALDLLRPVTTTPTIPPQRPAK